MHVFVADLHKDRAGLSEQVTRYTQAVSEICKVTMNAVSPGVTERLHLLRLARDMQGITVPHVATGRTPLKIAVELDAVRRVDVDALHLSSQALALREADHYLERVAEDHAVR